MLLFFPALPGTLNLMFNEIDFVFKVFDPVILFILSNTHGFIDGIERLIILIMHKLFNRQVLHSPIWQSSFHRKPVSCWVRISVDSVFRILQLHRLK